MKRVDTGGWKEFKLTDIFRMQNTKSIVQKDIIPDSGTVPYVTAQSGNNGVLTYISCPDEWMDEGDCIMVGGKTLVFSYQKYSFCSNDSHNIALYLKDKAHATEMCYLFLIIVLRRMLCEKYSWGAMERIQSDTFYIPVTPSGKPDWAYMETYMRSVMAKAESVVDRLSAVTGI